jgi:hypothetical protein
MKRSTLYEITLRITGIITALQAVMSLKELLFVIWSIMTNSRQNMEFNYSVSFLIGPAVQFGFLVITSWLLLFRTEEIVKLFNKNDPGDRIDFLTDHRSVLEAAVIVVGGLLFIQGVLSFFQEIAILYMSMKDINSKIPASSKLDLFFIGLKAFIGYCLIFVSRRIAGYLIKKQSQDVKEEE